MSAVEKLDLDQLNAQVRSLRELLDQTSLSNIAKNRIVDAFLWELLEQLRCSH